MKEKWCPRCTVITNGEGRANRDNVVDCLQQFPTWATVGVVGAWLVTGIVVAGEGMVCEEMNARGEDGSGETC